MIKKIILASFVATLFLVTPSYAATNWLSNHTTLKNSQLSQAVGFNRNSNNYGVGTKNVSGGMTQGGTITEKYYVFSNFHSNNSKSQVYIANRSDGKIIKEFSGYWGHINTINYKWGTGQVYIKSRGTCIDVEKLKNLGDNYADCKTKSAPDWDPMSGSGVLTQGEAKYRDHVFYIATDKSTYDNYIGVYEHKSHKFVKAFRIPNSFADGEAEDISIDGDTGDVYVNYYIFHGNALIAYIKVDHSAFGDMTKPIGKTSSKKDSEKSEKNEPKVLIAPTHETQCASIFAFLCQDAEKDGSKTIIDIIKFVIGTMTIGIGVLATIGIIISGFMIMTARDNQEQVSKGKKRILEVVIGILVWVLLAALLSLLLPKTEEIEDIAQTKIVPSGNYYGDDFNLKV